MQCQLVAEVAAFGDFDRVDLTNEVGNGGIRGGELLAVSLRPVHPRDGRVFAQVGHRINGPPRNGAVRIVVDLRALDDGKPLVQQADESTDHPRLGLPPLPQQNDVVTCQYGVFELRNDRVVKAEDAGHQRLAAGDTGHRVAPQLFGHGHRLPARSPQFAERPCQFGRRLQRPGPGGR